MNNAQIKRISEVDKKLITKKQLEAMKLQEAQRKELMSSGLIKLAMSSDAFQSLN